LIGWVAALLLPQAEEVLLNEPQLLSKALDNPITGVGDWADFQSPDQEGVMMGYASGSNMARHVSMANGSSIYILAAEEASPSIYRAIAGGSEPWAVMPCDPYAVGMQLPDIEFLMAMFDVQQLVVEGGGFREEEEEGEEGEGEEEGEWDQEEAVSRPCGVLYMM
jgi:hypothetical protein